MSREQLKITTRQEGNFPIIDGNFKFWCFRGRRRILAARLAFGEDYYFTVRVFIETQVESLTSFLRHENESFLHETQPTDGEIFSRIRTDYRYDNIGAGRWFRQWNSWKLGGINVAIAARIDELIIFHIDYIADVWDYIVDNKPEVQRLIDIESVQLVQFRAPSISPADYYTLSAAMDSGKLFPYIHDRNTRQQIKTKLLVYPETDQEGQFHSAKGTPSLGVCFMILFIAALRDFPNLSKEQPLHDRRGESICFKLNNTSVKRLCQRAQLLGFFGSKITNGLTLSDEMCQSDDLSLLPTYPLSDWRGGKPFLRTFAALKSTLATNSELGFDNVLPPKLVEKDIIRAFFGYITIEMDPNTPVFNIPGLQQRLPKNSTITTPAPVILLNTHSGGPSVISGTKKKRTRGFYRDSNRVNKGKVKQRKREALTAEFIQTFSEGAVTKTPNKSVPALARLSPPSALPAYANQTSSYEVDISLPKRNTMTRPAPIYPISTLDSAEKNINESISNIQTVIGEEDLFQIETGDEEDVSLSAPLSDQNSDNRTPQKEALSGSEDNENFATIATQLPTRTVQTRNVPSISQYWAAEEGK
ncbi:hypothetical protein QBC38DRAFT_447279 [Podospora fimiseda]|uniref:Uncharacterized protein n=1 Tax=Podospora fimiseda TaxID=252190 RepID=A0AAN7GSG5_9PEZI|nr:hypothetical protein QBC38DRAFT_447279 [Podospora fimiseda]